MTDEKRRCEAIAKYTGNRCQRWAIRGTTKCKGHTDRSEERRLARRQQRISFRVGAMARALEDSGITLETADPSTGLRDAIRRAGALVWVFGELVGELSIKPTFTQVTMPDGSEASYPDSLEGWNSRGETATHVLLREYRAAIDLYARLCKIALDTGLTAEAVRVEREKAQLMASAVQGVLRDLALTPEQRSLAPTLIRRHLLALDEAEPRAATS